MKRTVLFFVVVLLAGCGPQEGDKYQTTMNGEPWTVTVTNTGTYESLANQAQMMKTMADTSSVLQKQVILNKDLDSKASKNKGSDAVLFKWEEREYNDLYDKTETLIHYRVSTADEFESIFTKVE